MLTAEMAENWKSGADRCKFFGYYHGISLSTMVKWYIISLQGWGLALKGASGSNMFDNPKTFAYKRNWVAGQAWRVLKFWCHESP